MQADPYLAPEALKNPQGWNRYAYVAGDPVNYYDPAGLDACSGNYGAPCFSITVVRFLYFLRLRSFGGGGGGSSDLFVAEAAEPLELNENWDGLITVGPRPFQDYARSLVESWLDELPKSNRWKYLKGYGGDLRASLEQTRFYDATGEHATLRLSQIFPGVNIPKDGALKDLSRPAGALAMTLSLNRKITPNVVIWERELPYPGAIFYLLAHEMLHVASRRNDADLRKQFGLTPETDLTEWLARDCKL